MKYKYKFTRWHALGAALGYIVGIACAHLVKWYVCGGPL